MGANKQTIRYFFPFFRISDRILRAEKWREVQKSITPMLDLETIRLVSEISEHHLILLLVCEIMNFEQLAILFQILHLLHILCLSRHYKVIPSSATLTSIFSNSWYKISNILVEYQWHCSSIYEDLHRFAQICVQNCFCYC